jgi:serine O-acetyltransferase
VRIVELLRQVTFPGFVGPAGQPPLTPDALPGHITSVIAELAELMFEQVRLCLRYKSNLAETDRECARCDDEARTTVADVLAAIPRVRELISTDVQAAYDADPAAQNTDETILSYPGLFAICVQRFAHEFHTRGVPMLPRMMTEHAHSLTGIDIHPGAKIGRRFFIDHGTGIVIGETTTIGDNVKIYQGVTLGGLSPDRLVEHFRGGVKRHPTIENDVTIYANATILGGETTIGQNSVVGGNVFLTASVPANTLVAVEDAKLNYRQRRTPKDRKPTTPAEHLDFQI